MADIEHRTSMTIGEALRIYASELASITDDPALEARMMIQKVTGLSRPVLLSHPETVLSPTHTEQLQGMISSRKQGVPLPYILGEWEFYGHSFFVNPSVLIPRPETELLVEEASHWLKNHPYVRIGFDIGTGSGCIAISLLLAFPKLLMTTVDIKRDALCTACANAENHQVRERFFAVQTNLYAPFNDAPAILCANLPYIPSKTCTHIEPAKFEPLTALDGGSDGFDLYRLLFQQLTDKIKPGSLILCEIEYRQEELALTTAQRFFPKASVQVKKDLAGLPRLLRIEL